MLENVYQKNINNITLINSLCKKRNSIQFLQTTKLNGSLTKTNVLFYKIFNNVEN